MSIDDFESSIPGLTNLISAPKGRVLFLPESLVTSQQEKNLTEMKSDSDVDPVSVAKAFGVSHEELMRQQTEALLQAKENLSAKNKRKLQKQRSWHDHTYEPIPGHPSPYQSRDLRGHKLSASRVINQQHCVGVLSSPSQRSQFQPLDIGSPIQIPSDEYEHPLRYGVIRWIGELPGVQGPVAGVELVSCRCSGILNMMQSSDMNDFVTDRAITISTVHPGRGNGWLY